MGRTACTEPQCLYSRAITLLPLWAVRLVQSLSACTVELYLYSPMGRTACTEPQRLYSRAIPLLPLMAVRTVQSLSACTVELILYAPMGWTAYTEPQCLYKGDLYLTTTWIFINNSKMSKSVIFTEMTPVHYIIPPCISRFVQLNLSLLKSKFVF
jgi:hypothetical protein